MGGGEQTGRVVRVRTPARAGRGARQQRELGLGHPAAELGGDKGDGFGAAVGEEQPVTVDVHGLGQRGRGPGRIGIAADGVEVAGDDSADVGGDGIEAHGQVEHVDPQGCAHPWPVPAVRTGSGDHASTATAAVTCWERRTARSMSRGSGGRPVPSGGRSSTRLP